MLRSTRVNKQLFISQYEINCISHIGHKDSITFEFTGSNLDKKDLFSESDPFFTISRENPDDSFSVVYRSDYIQVSNWNMQ